MPDPTTIRFYDYYDAQFAAHQMELDGHRAIVCEWIYNLGAWPNAQYRVIVFHHGLDGEPNADGSAPQFGEFEQSALADRVDTFFRFLAIVSICGALLLLLGVLILFGWYLLSLEPAEMAKAVIPITISCAAIVVGLRFTILAYEGYRGGHPAATWLMRCTGIALFLFPGWP